MGALMRNAGMPGTLVPIMKRATVRLSTGAVARMFVDTNMTTANGDDKTGVAKFIVYVGKDAPVKHIDYAPAVAPASSTKAAVCSMTLDDANNMYVVYQGVDNSLRMIKWTYTGDVAPSWNTPVEQIVSAANAVTNRFRAVDIDVSPSGTPVPAVICTEANASTGIGATTRVFVRLTDGTTWRNAWTHVHFAAQPRAIKPQSEDVSIAWDTTPFAANIGRMAIFQTCSDVQNDWGDIVGELSFNVATGAANSAVQIGFWWNGNLHQNIAAGARRGWLYSEAPGVWVFASAVGTSAPFFWAARLYHNTFTGMVQNKTSVSANAFTTRGLFIVRLGNGMSSISTSYNKGVLIFGFAGLGITSTRAARALFIRFDPANTANKNALSIDSSARMLDQGYTLHSGVLGIYSGGNRNINWSQGGLHFNVVYGDPAATVSALAGQNQRVVRSVYEDSYPAPKIISPAGNIIPKNRPELRVSLVGQGLYSNVNAKIEWMIARDPGMSTDVRVIKQPDSQFMSYDVSSGSSQPTRVISYTLSLAEELYSGDWYIQAHALYDTNGLAGSPWSPDSDFNVEHPPVAQPVSPTEGTTKLFGAGTVLCSWKFSDTEPTDTQSAYQLIVARVDTGGVVYDSNKTVSSVKTATATLDPSLKDVALQWRVALWDSDNVQGDFSTPVIFTLADPPDVVITSPTAAQVLTTALPTVGWNFTVGGARIQRAFRVRVLNTDVTPAATVGDSGWVFSAATTYTFQSQILTNMLNYKVVVEVQDNVGMQDISPEVAFSADWIEPVQALATVAADPFKVTVSWTDAEIDPEWVTWRVYRRYRNAATDDTDMANTRSIWVLIHETDINEPAMEYRDYFVPQNRSVDYAVVQLVDRFGSLIESDLITYQTVQTAGDRYYFVPEIPVGAIASFEASNVVGDGFTREIEQETVHVKGRGRQVQIGDDLGYSGTLTIHLRNPDTARRDREFIEYLSGPNAGNVYIRSPFGDVLYVAFGNVAFTRLAGVGIGDLGDLTVPYSEVFNDIPIMRMAT